MSFFRKKKEVDLVQQERAIDKEIAIEKSLTEKARAEDEPALKEGEVRVKNIETRSKNVVSDETSRERNRLKYKDTSGLLSSQEKNTYPSFTVFYLGRIPTNSEYGNEAVEGPVDQLCKFRDKQKLPKVLINFDTEGFTVKEIVSTLFTKQKSKKDGMDLFIPLHHITYGVASEGHPLVFACIARMTEDDTGVDDGLPVLMLYAFLCDKPDAAQQITYWQLQAYIEAYEELKRKKILRNRRKQALGTRKHNMMPQDDHMTYQQPLPIYGSEPPPPMEQNGNEPLYASPNKGRKTQSEENGNDPLYAAPNKGSKVHTEVVESEPLYGTPKKGHKVKNKGFVKPTPIDLPDYDVAKEESMSQTNSSTEASSPTEFTRSDSITSDDSAGGGSRDRAFEKRIMEMNDLMVEVDAEILKKLMISKHTSLARNIYFTKPGTHTADSRDSEEENEDNSNV